MLSTTVKVGFCRQKSKFVLFSHEILCCKTFQTIYYLLETDRISFSFLTPKLHICRFQHSFVFGPNSFSAHYRFWQSPKLKEVFISCKSSRIFCVQPSNKARL